MDHRAGVPDWQVLVVAYNSEAELPRMVRSIEQHLPATRGVLIWCNSDVDRLRGALAEVREHATVPVEVHGDGSNLGFAEACNRLAALAESERVLFLNPDTEIQALDGVMAADPHQLVAPLVHDEAGVLQKTFGPERTLRREALIRLAHRDPAVEEPASPSATGFVSGAAFAVDRRRFLDVGGFDTGYFMYYEDLDLCRRWQAAGGTIWVDPAFRIMHVGGASASSNRLLALQRSHESAERYHGRTRASRTVFRSVALVEALLKSALAGVRGRVGQIDRATQWAFTSWTWSRSRSR